MLLQEEIEDDEIFISHIQYIVTNKNTIDKSPLLVSGQSFLPPFSLPARGDGDEVVIERRTSRKVHNVSPFAIENNGSAVAMSIVVLTAVALELGFGFFAWPLPLLS